jgi:hypothetical protein
VKGGCIDEPAILSEAKIQNDEPAILSEAKIQNDEPAILSEAKVQAMMSPRFSARRRFEQ